MSDTLNSILAKNRNFATEDSEEIQKNCANFKQYWLQSLQSFLIHEME